MRHRATLFLFCAAAGAAACASIWGFEDAIPVGPDGGATADAAVIVDDEVVPSNVPGIVCVPRGPADWQGPLLIYESDGKPPPEPPPCPSTHPKPTDGRANLQPGTCKCGCGPVTGATCAPPTISIYNDQGACNANATPCRTMQLTQGTCNAYPDAAGCNAQNTFAKVTSAPAMGGSCAPSGPGELDPVTWGAAVRICAPPTDVAATCPADKVATPQAELPYQTNYCIAVTSTAACPALYPKQRIYFTGTTGQRSCTCSCGAPTGGGCSPQIELRDDGACGAGQKGNPDGGSCTGATNASSVRLLNAGSPSGMSCTPSANVTGDLQPSGPLTICCRR